MIPESILLAGAGIGLFILGVLFGMAMERSASGNVGDSEEDLTDWEGDQ